MLASAAGPSSQGVWNSRWSFAVTAENPHSRAASTAPQPRQGERLVTEPHQRQVRAELHGPILPNVQDPGPRGRTQP